MQKTFILFLVFLVPILGIFYLSFKYDTWLPYEDEMMYLRTIYVKAVPLKVEIADTPEKRSRGLSGRESLAPNNGMFFVFENSDIYGIWMKDMNFPIDIIWIDENFKIIDVERNARPESFPKIFRPRIPAKYILEVNSTFSRIYNIEIGDMILL